MRAAVIAEPGGPEMLRITEVPDPVPGPGEVLVDITAAGLNRADLLQRRGLYPPPPGAPPYPGLECSGRVSAVGGTAAGGTAAGGTAAGGTAAGGTAAGGTAAGGTGQPGGWRIGDEVCALLAGGGYAERVAVPAGQVLPLPGGVTLTEAAALPEVACTVYANVFLSASLAPGQTLLVHGGASGIGTMAIQLAKAHGARVVCTAGSPAKLERCRELGADLAVSYAGEDFVEAVREFTGGNGADVILDIMGAAYLPRNVSALATGGRLVVIGTQGGNRGELDLGLLLRKRASVHASSLRARPVAEKAKIVAEVRDHVWPLVTAGKVAPVVDRVLPLAEAAQAHQLMEDGAHIGKILLAT